MTYDPEKFRGEIRKLLRDIEGDMGSNIASHYAKFNEDLEHRLEQSNMRSSLDNKLYDLMIQTGNHGYMAGVQLGLKSGAEKVKSIDLKIDKIKKQVVDNVDKTKNSAPDQRLQKIEKNIISIKFATGLILLALGYIMWQLSFK